MSYLRTFVAALLMVAVVGVWLMTLSICLEADALVAEAGR